MRCSWKTLAPLALAGLLTGSAQADMVVQGEFRYVDREYTYDGWTGNWPELPVRHAEVLVLDAVTSEVLASGTTDAQGGYALTIVGTGQVDLVVRCLTRSTTLGPMTVEVITETAGQVYSVSSPIFPAWDLSQPLDAGVVAAQPVLKGTQKGSPFNVYDQIVLAFEYVGALGAPPTTMDYVMQWPADKTASWGPAGWVQFYRGYSDSVVLHELGHSMDIRYGMPDSPGGQHWFGQSDQEPSLSLSEGFANYFQAAARLWAGHSDPGIYFSGSAGPATGASSILTRWNLETRKPYANSTGGEADEVAVTASLWNVADTTWTPDGDAVDDDPVDGSFLFPGGIDGPQLVWEALTSPTVHQAEDVHVIDIFDAMFVDLGVPDYDALSLAFAECGIRTDMDAYEPNDLPETATPIPVSGIWSDVHTLWSSTATLPVPGRNDVDYFTVHLDAGRKYQLETRYPNGVADAETYADTAIFLTTPSGGLGPADDSSGVGRNARIDLVVSEPGDWVAKVLSLNPSRPTGTYQLRVVDLGPVPAPSLAKVEPGVYTTVSPGFKWGLELHGSGFLGTTSVDVEGVGAEYWVKDDTLISFNLPATGKLGTHLVTITSASGSATASFEVVAPPVPTLTAEGTYWAWSDASIWFGSQPGDGVLLLMSTINQPTSLPGLVDLDLGAGGSDLFLIATHVTDASGWIELVFPLPDVQGSSLDLWFQGAVLPAGGTTLPLGTTQLTTNTLH